jgi:hypothetical protein
MSTTRETTNFHERENAYVKRKKRFMAKDNGLESIRKPPSQCLISAAEEI